MQTTTREYKIADDQNHLKIWLEAEYPRGLDLYYVDYRDSLDDNPKIMMQLVRDGYSEKLDESMLDYDNSYTFDEIEKNYLASLEDVDEISDDLREYIRDWCYEHDTSDYQKDLLRNTGAQLFFIDTGVEVYENNKNLSAIIKKFGKQDERKISAIKWLGNEQMYHSTIAFYFHADPSDIIDALHRQEGDYIAIDGAMIANVTRGNGSNWVHDDNIFQLVIPKKAFIANVYKDDEAGTGYGWHSICGDWNRDECRVTSQTTKTIKGYSYIEGETSLTTIKEQEYTKTWDSGRGKCTLGDMNITRHKTTEYINEYPCGTHCKECGNFWID
jgi:hypothetical protein